MEPWCLDYSCIQKEAHSEYIFVYIPRKKYLTSHHIHQIHWYKCWFHYKIFQDDQHLQILEKNIGLARIYVEPKYSERFYAKIW